MTGRMRVIVVAGALVAMLALFDRAAAAAFGAPPSDGTVGLVLGLLAAYALGGVSVLTRPVVAAALFGLAALLGHRLDATSVSAGAIGWDGIGLALAAASLLSARGTAAFPPASRRHDAPR